MSQPNTESTPLKIAAMGDIMLDRQIGQAFLDDPERFEFREIAEELSNYDLVIANLENPVGIRGTPDPRQDPNVAFCAHPRTLKVLKNLGIHLVTIANNHLLDYGEQTLLDTCEHLDDAEIKHLGAGKDYADANRPQLLEVCGRKIAVVASNMIYSASTLRAGKSTPGVADYAVSAKLKQIKKLVSQGYQVIVTVHWGIEYCFYPIPYQRKQAQQMIDAGASLIIGHGPHYPQGIETYANGEIVHSLGNFIFDEPYRFTKKSFIYGAELDSDGSLLTSHIMPVSLVDGLPVLEHNENNKTKRIVSLLGPIYQRKKDTFWHLINDRWFSNIVWRISTMKSYKFARLAPLGFYFTIARTTLPKKLTLKNFSWLFRSIASKFFPKSKEAKVTQNKGQDI